MVSTRPAWMQRLILRTFLPAWIVALAIQRRRLLAARGHMIAAVLVYAARVTMALMRQLNHQQAIFLPIYSATRVIQQMVGRRPVSVMTLKEITLATTGGR